MEMVVVGGEWGLSSGQVPPTPNQGSRKCLKWREEGEEREYARAPPLSRASELI